MDTHAIATELADRHHVSPEYAEDSVDDLVRQIEQVDERSIDTDDINPDDVEFLRCAFAASLTNDDNGRSELAADLTDIADQLRALQQEADTLAAERNELIRRLWAHGMTVRGIVDAAGLNQSRVYAIINAEEN